MGWERSSQGKVGYYPCSSSCVGLLISLVFTILYINKYIQTWTEPIMDNDNNVIDQQLCVPEMQGNVGGRQQRVVRAGVSGESMWTEARMRWTSHVGMGVKSFPGWGDSMYKGPEVGPSLLCLRNIQEASTSNSNNSNGSSYRATVRPLRSPKHWKDGSAHPM